MGVLSYKPQNLGLTGLSRKGFRADVGNLRLTRRVGELDSGLFGSELFGS